MTSATLPLSLPIRCLRGDSLTPRGRATSRVLKAVQRNRAVAPITPEAWVLYYLQRLAPWLVRWIHARVGERNRKRFSSGAN